jgi:hypothetical protein
MKRVGVILAALLLIAFASAAQQPKDDEMQNMPGMDMPANSGSAPASGTEKK